MKATGIGLARHPTIASLCVAAGACSLMIPCIGIRDDGLALDNRGEQLEVVLTHYEVSIPSGYGYKKVRCPLLSHTDRRASATVHMDKGTWQCFACGDH